MLLKIETYMAIPNQMTVLLKNKTKYQIGFCSSDLKYSSKMYNNKLLNDLFLFLFLFYWLEFMNYLIHFILVQLRQGQKIIAGISGT